MRKQNSPIKRMIFSYYTATLCALVTASFFVSSGGCQTETRDTNPEQIEKRRQEFEQQSIREFSEG